MGPNYYGADLPKFFTTEKKNNRGLSFLHQRKTNVVSLSHVSLSLSISHVPLCLSFSRLSLDLSCPSSSLIFLFITTWKIPLLLPEINPHPSPYSCHPLGPERWGLSMWDRLPACRCCRSVQLTPSGNYLQQYFSGFQASPSPGLATPSRLLEIAASAFAIGLVWKSTLKLDFFSFTCGVMAPKFRLYVCLTQQLWSFDCSYRCFRRDSLALIYNQKVTRSLRNFLDWN